MSDIVFFFRFRWGSGSNSLQFIVPPVDALRSFVGPSVKITSSLSNDLNAGPNAARGKDAAFVFVNAYGIPKHPIIPLTYLSFCSMSGELGFYDIVVGNEGDRNDLALWWNGGSLVRHRFRFLTRNRHFNWRIQVQKVAAVCNNTIVIVHSVGPVDLTWSAHPNVTGIIYAGAPGEQTGPSIVDVLFGAYNPRGRLPFSISDVRPFYSSSPPSLLFPALT